MAEMSAKEFLMIWKQACVRAENCSCCHFRAMCEGQIGTVDSDTTIALTEEQRDIMYPFGYCKKCGNEFNSELINEYEIKHCPWCGEKIGE